MVLELSNKPLLVGFTLRLPADSDALLYLCHCSHAGKIQLLIVPGSYVCLSRFNVVVVVGCSNLMSCQDFGNNRELFFISWLPTIYSVITSMFLKIGYHKA